MSHSISLSRPTDKGAATIKTIDWFTIVLYLILVVAGAISVYAASYDFDNASMFDFKEFSGKQFLWIGLGLVLGSVIMLLDYRLFESYAYPIYGCILLLLLLTIFIAPNVKGSHSWIVMGPVSLQPAEFGKFATALALAKLFSTYNFKLNDSLNNYFLALIIIFLPIILILMQRETGSALVYLSLVFVLYREGMSGLVLMSGVCAVAYFVLALKFSSTLTLGMPTGDMMVMSIILGVYVVMLFSFCKNWIMARNCFLGIAGVAAIAATLACFGIMINGWILFSVALLGCIVYTVIGMFRHKIQNYVVTISVALVSVMFLLSVNYVFGSVLEDHQQKRIMVTLGIEDDIRDAGYNVNQSKIAIGSGGLEGKGFLNGTQTKLKYVPEQHTDFIFCTIGEEEGFIGSTAVLLLFLALILRLIHVAERQRTVFGRVYAYCVVSYLIFHLCINIGMVIGLCPVIGIPLPFFSYGGSALWGFTILLFILLRIDAARKDHHDAA